jgi:hypothetical protein
MLQIIYHAVFDCDLHVQDSNLEPLRPSSLEKCGKGHLLRGKPGAFCETVSAQKKPNCVPSKKKTTPLGVPGMLASNGACGVVLDAL